MPLQSSGRFDSEQKPNAVQTRAFVFAWAFTVVFYFLEYAVRSSPSVMIPELEASFHTTALGISAILGVYYYTYSSVSLIAGAALDHLGAKHTVPVGFAVLGIGCLLFQCIDGTRRGYWTTVARGGLGVRIHWCSLSSGARIPRALSRDCHWRHAMRRNARRLGWTISCRAND